jgi:hypothetical protein
VTSAAGGAAPQAGPAVERIGRAGRLVRAAAVVAVAALAIAGSLFGQDDDFPFGPFRMYSTTDDPNKPVVEILIFATDEHGRRFELNENNSGVRRAEVEGQLAKFVNDLSLEAAMADAWNRRHPSDIVRQVEIVQRAHELSRGSPTGRITDTVLATWVKGAA